MIGMFTGQYDFLSNFYPYYHNRELRIWVRKDVSWPGVNYEGLLYPSSEHAYQAAKVIDPNTRALLADIDSPGQIKKTGRKLKLRSGWDTIRIPVMREILQIKFSDPILRRMLLDTGDKQLIEGNWWNDRFWGVCNGVGENNLGKLLMELREEIHRGS